MKSRVVISIALVGLVCAAAWTATAQQSAAVAPVAVSATSTVPNLINYSGVLKDASGRTLTTLTGVTFLLYQDEQGGAPLWMETQNVTPDRTGRYPASLRVSESGSSEKTEYDRTVSQTTRLREGMQRRASTNSSKG